MNEAIALAHYQIAFLLRQILLDKDYIVGVEFKVDLVCGQLDSAFVILKDYERRLVNKNACRVLAFLHNQMF